MTIAAASCVAGHSLGEYSALAAAGAVSIGDAARLLRTRGEAMQAAVPVGEGAMAAILGLDFEAAQAVAEEAAPQGEVCQAANDNDPDTGCRIRSRRAAVERAAGDRQGKRRAKRAVMLPVICPVPLCFDGSRRPRSWPRRSQVVEIKAPAVPVDGQCPCRGRERPRRDPASLLVEQVTGSVRWRESVGWMAARGCHRDLGNRRGQSSVGHDPPD